MNIKSTTLFVFFLFSQAAGEEDDHSSSGMDHSGHTSDMGMDQSGHTGDMGMDHSGHSSSGIDPSVNVFCVKACSSTNEDPCGDGMGQRPACTAVTLQNPTEYGFDASNPPSTFLGCSYDVCANVCAGTDPNSASDLQGDTICFPRMESMDGMFALNDDANLAAVARGCVGSHSMGEMGIMIGSTHIACESTFTKGGVPLGSSAAPASSMSPLLIAAMIGLGTAIATL